MNRRILVLFLILTAGLAACAPGSVGTSPTPAGGSASAGGTTPAALPPTAQPPATAALSITSPVFEPNGDIPAKYTCQGEDISPAVTWKAPPSGTKSLALILDDPDAPGGTWVHWVVYNLPPDTTGLPESASRGNSTAANLPQGAVQGKNSFNRVNYGGPCPPSGKHHYIFHLYALDTTVTGETLNKSALLKAMEGHVLGQGELVGLYQKQ